jgi:hypothetical protein
MLKEIVDEEQSILNMRRNLLYWALGLTNLLGLTMYGLYYFHKIEVNLIVGILVWITLNGLFAWGCSEFMGKDLKAIKAKYGAFIGKRVVTDEKAYDEDRHKIQSELEMTRDELFGKIGLRNLIANVVVGIVAVIWQLNLLKIFGIIVVMNVVLFGLLSIPYWSKKIRLAQNKRRLNE